MNNIHISIEVKIKEIRVRTGLLQRDVAQKLNIDRSTVAKWEAGEANPSVNNLVKLAEIFDCTVDEILNKKGE